MIHVPTWITANTYGCRSVLDLGCMKGRKLLCVAKGVERRVGIEIYGRYIDEATPQRKRECELIHGDMRNYRALIGNQRFDCCMLIDSLEHLDKEDGKGLLRDCCEDFKRILVFTPNGFVEQGDDDNAHQKHLSGWTREDLEAFGFLVTVDPTHHQEWSNGAIPNGALFARWDAPIAEMQQFGLGA